MWGGGGEVTDVRRPLIAAVVWIEALVQLKIDKPPPPLGPRGCPVGFRSFSNTNNVTYVSLGRRTTYRAPRRRVSENPLIGCRADHTIWSSFFFFLSFFSLFLFSVSDTGGLSARRTFDAYARRIGKTHVFLEQRARIFLLLGSAAAGNGHGS